MRGGPPVALDGHDLGRPGRPPRRGTPRTARPRRRGRPPTPPAAGAAASSTVVDEHLGRRHVRLPEPVGRSTGTLASPCTSRPAPCDGGPTGSTAGARCARSGSGRPPPPRGTGACAGPRRTAGQVDVLHPRAPAEPVGSTGTPRPPPRRIPASRDSCSPTTAALRSRWCGGLDVLEVAAAAAAGSGVAGTARTPGAARPRAPRPRRRAGTGRPPPSVISTTTRSPGQRVPDEHDDAGTRRGRALPADEVPAMGDRATWPRRVAVARRPHASCRSPRGRRWTSLRSAAARGSPACVRPRRTSPGRTRWSSHSSRSFAISDARSW